ncbi:hypothetical protein [Planktothricoides sp. SR001]|nr:hypothetical protein [Planktothricoides sp. SR001]
MARKNILRIREWQIIIDVIPELELIISSQPAVAEVGLVEAQNRFN